MRPTEEAPLILRSALAARGREGERRDPVPPRTSGRRRAAARARGRERETRAQIEIEVSVGLAFHCLRRRRRHNDGIGSLCTVNNAYAIYGGQRGHQFISTPLGILHFNYQYYNYAC